MQAALVIAAVIVLWLLLSVFAIATYRVLDAAWEAWHDR